MKRRSSLSIGLLLCVLLTGCTAATNNPLALLRGEPQVLTSMLATRNIEATSRPSDCYIDIVLDRSPERPFVVIGEATALWTGTDSAALSATDRVVMEDLISEACEAGGHVMFRMRSHYQDQWVPRTSSAPRDRDMLVRTIRSTSLVGVYVRRDGNLMPAPRAPRRVIRVPTSLDRTSAPSQAIDEAEELAWDQGIMDPWAIPID